MEHNTKTSSGTMGHPVEFRTGDTPSTVTEHHGFSTLLCLTAE